MIKNIAVVFIVLVANGAFLQGQSPYTLDAGRELRITGYGAGLHALSYWIHAKNEILRPEAIEALNPEAIWRFDRWVVHQYSAGARKSSDIALYSSFALPLTLLADHRSRKDFGAVGLMTAQTLLINTGLTNVTKVLVQRPRPFLYNPEVPIELKLGKTSRYSFFSGHTSTTACMSFLTAQLYSDYYPDSDIKPLVWSLAIGIPAFTGIQRVRGGKHFLSDVLVGYVVGAAVGLLVPELHK